MLKHWQLAKNIDTMLMQLLVLAKGKNIEMLAFSQNTGLPALVQDCVSIGTCPKIARTTVAFGHEYKNTLTTMHER